MSDMSGKEKSLPQLRRQRRYVSTQERIRRLFAHTESTRQPTPSEEYLLEVFAIMFRVIRRSRNFQKFELALRTKISKRGRDAHLVMGVYQGEKFVCVTDDIYSLEVPMNIFSILHTWLSFTNDSYAAMRNASAHLPNEALLQEPTDNSPTAVEQRRMLRTARLDKGPSLAQSLYLIQNKDVECDLLGGWLQLSMQQFQKDIASMEEQTLQRVLR